ncbi:transcriptional regulator [Methyloprofundus sedimenti]|uniref:Transcriptional regulator n=1 Tax=Methyloprofundus sedimenti TaxID=1420851 RepID=A0A1V8M4S2_9GAMM|nr:Rho-binding antiterminator [Methyloprofundus sedimenti]OQK16544.1 transcriptional regulator [Methyloprofundus sedimenti]
MHQPAIISCALHDYIEIACLYGYQIKLLLKDGQTVAGKAINILSTPEKREYLLLACEQQIKIELIEIKELQVLTPQAKFQSVSFT